MSGSRVRPPYGAAKKGLEADEMQWEDGSKAR